MQVRRCNLRLVSQTNVRVFASDSNAFCAAA
jgi:hypothetical protein